MVEKSVIPVGDIAVNLTENPGKPLVILTRMASQDMGIWDTIWGDFARHFTVANFDLRERPGAARMDDPGTGFRLLAQDCADVAAGLGHPEFHIFGWNGGTQIAMRCAVDHAERVRSCILLDPFFELADMRKVDKAVEFKERLFTNPDRALYAFYWVMAGLSPGFMENNFDQVEALVAARMGGDRFVKSDPGPFIRWVKALRRNWIADAEFARITAPTLILSTELDNWHAGPTVSMGREVARRIPGARFEVIEGVGGHFLFEDPGRFITLAEPFMRSVTRPTAP